VDKSDRMINSDGITQGMEMDKEIVFPPSRHGHSQCLFIADVMWWKNDIKKSAKS
jgi:hypothetical protein